jgi:hypothetical protein
MVITIVDPEEPGLPSMVKLETPFRSKVAVPFALLMLTALLELVGRSITVFVEEEPEYDPIVIGNVSLLE